MKTYKEIRKAAREHSNNVNLDADETVREYAIKDFIAGAEWMQAEQKLLHSPPVSLGERAVDESLRPAYTFNAKAEYNKWLKELTDSERELVHEMMEEYSEIVFRERAMGFSEWCAKEGWKWFSNNRVWLWMPNTSREELRTNDLFSLYLSTLSPSTAEKGEENQIK